MQLYSLWKLKGYKVGLSKQNGGKISFVRIWVSICFGNQCLHQTTFCSKLLTSKH